MAKNPPKPEVLPAIRREYHHLFLVNFIKPNRRDSTTMIYNRAYISNSKFRQVFVESWPNDIRRKSNNKDKLLGHSKFEASKIRFCVGKEDGFYWNK
ncbi:hypothetical protein L6164_025813 [Bauhinia variegata]|uniref:Uncharacterized protein n=1 Tax=Bauhinia variegata TaxID=167791 RepID=A0ACB9M1Q6_BAUVA|nr:hypothetical protein L6164_025813 [Bauhinia variegata]